MTEQNDRFSPAQTDMNPSVREQGEAGEVNNWLHLTHLELGKVVEALETKLELREARIKNLESLLNLKDAKIQRVTAIIQDAFDEGGWDEDDEMLKALAEELELEFEDTTTITITATWTAEVKHPKNFDLDLGEIYVEDGIRALTLSYGSRGNDKVEFEDDISDPEIEVDEA